MFKSVSVNTNQRILPYDRTWVQFSRTFIPYSNSTSSECEKKNLQTMNWICEFYNVGAQNNFYLFFLKKLKERCRLEGRVWFLHYPIHREADASWTSKKSKTGLLGLGDQPGSMLQKQLWAQKSCCFAREKEAGLRIPRFREGRGKKPFIVEQDEKPFSYIINSSYPSCFDLSPSFSKERTW